MHWVFWALAGAAAAHALEEWLLGWSRLRKGAGGRPGAVYAWRKRALGIAAFAPSTPLSCCCAWREPWRG